MILWSVLAFLAAGLPWVWRAHRREVQHVLLARQLHASLVQLVQALRVGVSLQQGFEYVAHESAPPLSLEWKRLLRRLSLGDSWSDALGELPFRVPVAEVKWFVMALEITRKSGGSLADVLESLASMIEERQMARDKVDALTAQGKASGLVLAALPFVVLGALRLFVPDLVHPMFTTSLGQSMIAGVFVLVAVGGWMMWRLTRVSVET